MERVSQALSWLQSRGGKLLDRKLGLPAKELDST